MDIANHDPDRDVSCLHGSWIDGICKCNRGYVTEFTDTKLYPVYCAKKNDVVILNLRAGFEPVDIFHYATLSVCIISTPGGDYNCCLNLAYSICGCWELAGIFVLSLHSPGCLPTRPQDKESRKEIERV